MFSPIDYPTVDSSGLEYLYKYSTRREITLKYKYLYTYDGVASTISCYDDSETRSLYYCEANSLKTAYHIIILRWVQRCRDALQGFGSKG